MSFYFPDGTLIPAIGLGTWKANGDVAYEAVTAAISMGYRHIDTAFEYGNEKDVGRAIREKIADGTIKRSEIFITTKLWCTYHREGDVVKNIIMSLDNLGLDYVDLYLIHWPMSFQPGQNLFPKDENNKMIEGPATIEETWRGMETVKIAGLTKNIGVSNFNPKQILRILNRCKIKPVVNQLEAHPFLDNRDWIDFCTQHQILVVAYSPLGSPDRSWADPNHDVIFHENEVVKEIAQKYNKTSHQILLRFHVERKNCVIPKSVTPEHIRSNFDIFDFELSCEDMDKLHALGCGFRALSVDSFSHLREYPFN